MDVQKAVTEFLNANPNASNVTARKHAEAVFTDAKDVQRFLATLFQSKVRQAEF